MIGFVLVENSKPVSRILIFIMESMLKEVAAAAEGTASTWNSSSLHPGIQERVNLQGSTSGQWSEW